jgi:hypothetical protein
MDVCLDTSAGGWSAGRQVERRFSPILSENGVITADPRRRSCGKAVESMVMSREKEGCSRLLISAESLVQQLRS